MTGKRLSRSEIEAMLGGGTEEEAPAEASLPEEKKAVWEAVLDKAERRHRGEKIEEVEIDSSVETMAERLGREELKITPPKQDHRVTQSNLIQVVSQFSGADYTINIEPRHPRRPWGHRDEVIARLIAIRLNEVIPRSIEIEIRPPAPDWDIRLFTFIAKGLGNDWKVDLDELPRIEKKIADEMQAYCVRPGEGQAKR